MLWNAELKHSLQYLLLLSQLVVEAFCLWEWAFGGVDLPELAASADNDLVERTIGLAFEGLNKTPEVEAKVYPDGFPKSLTSDFYKKQLFFWFACCVGKYDSSSSLR